MSIEYRRLEAGEIIQLGDEYDGCRDPWRDEAKWLPVTENFPRLGQPAPDPKYPAHTIFRRPVCDHEWEVIDESFDHEYGTEQIVFQRCQLCGEERDYSPPVFDDDVI